MEKIHNVHYDNKIHKFKCKHHQYQRKEECNNLISSNKSSNTLCDQRTCKQYRKKSKSKAAPHSNKKTTLKTELFNLKFMTRVNESELFRLSIDNNTEIMSPEFTRAVLQKNSGLCHNKMEEKNGTEKIMRGPFHNGKSCNHSKKCIHRKTKKNHKQKKFKISENNKSVTDKNSVFSEKGRLLLPTISSNLNTNENINSNPSYAHLPLQHENNKICRKTYTSILNSIERSNDVPLSMVLQRKSKSIKHLQIENCEDDVVCLIKNSLKDYMEKNASLFEEKSKSCQVYESFGELATGNTQGSIVSEKNMNNLCSQSLAEYRKCITKKQSHQLITQSPDDKCVYNRKIFKQKQNLNADNFLKRKYKLNYTFSLEKIDKTFLIVRISKKPPKCKKHKSLHQSTHSIKFYEAHSWSKTNYRKFYDRFRNLISKTMKKISGESICSMLNSRMLQIQNINTSKNSIILNDLITHKHLKYTQLIKSLSDSCVDLGKKSKFHCIKCKKYKINPSFHKLRHGSRVMDFPPSISSIKHKEFKKKEGHMEYDITYNSDGQIHIEDNNEWHKLKKLEKPYSINTIKKSVNFKQYEIVKSLIDKHDGDTIDKTSSKDCNFEHSMSYEIYFCDGDKSEKYCALEQLNYSVEDHQCCFADPDLYYCVSETVIENVPPKPVKCNVIIKKKPTKLNTNLSKGEGGYSTDTKDKLSLNEEVYESSTALEDTEMLDKEKCYVKTIRNDKNQLWGQPFQQKNQSYRKEKYEQWVHNISPSGSEESIQFVKSVKENHPRNSSTSLRSDSGINCDSGIFMKTEVMRSRPSTPTVMRDVAISADHSPGVVTSSRTTIDKAIMCDEINGNKQKNDRIAENERIVMHGSSSDVKCNINEKKTIENYNKPNITDSITNPVNKEILKSLYQHEETGKCLEWYCNQVSSKSGPSITTSQVDIKVAKDGFLIQRDKCINKEDVKIRLKSDFNFVCKEEKNTSQPKNLWSSLKNGGQKVFSFFQPVGPLRTCFKKNIF